MKASDGGAGKCELRRWAKVKVNDGKNKSTNKKYDMKVVIEMTAKGERRRRRRRSVEYCNTSNTCIRFVWPLWRLPVTSLKKPERRLLR